MDKGTRPHDRIRRGRQPFAMLQSLLARVGGRSSGVRPDFSYDPIQSNPGPLLPEDRLIFLHIEKTAGTTAHHVLSAHFPEDQVCPARFGINVSLWESARLAHYRFYSLHASLRMISPIPGPKKVLTFLREPVARLLSHYNFWRSIRNDVVDQEQLDHIRYVKQFALKDLLAPAPLAATPDFWNLQAQRLAGDLFVAPSGRAWRDESELLDSALANLENLATVGITEYPHLSFQRIAEDLELPNHYDGMRLNVTANKVTDEPERFEPLNETTLDDETAEALDRATRLDRRLYDYGLGLFRDRLRLGVILKSSVPPHVRTRLIDGSEVVIGDHQEGNILFGPYCALPAGSYRATLWICAQAAMRGKRPGSITVDVCSGGSQKIHAVQSIRPLILSERWFDPVDIHFTLPDPADLVEIRMTVAGLAKLAVKRGVALRLL